MMKNKQTREFKLSELFDIYGSKYLSPNIEYGDVPFLDKTKINNGVVKFVDADKSILNYGNCITIGDHSAVAFYQEKSFLCSDHMNKLYLKQKFGLLNKYIALYICSVINKEINGKYNYGLIFAKNKCESTIISLPVDDNGTPD
ncbi:MAG: restriction endonuclease subunit S [Methanobrevibacter sp.]|nr:restriction endonuclease subunit S [Candidatus Methanovirga basalitermitum]